MRDQWEAVYSAAALVSVDSRFAPRVANLSIASALAHHRRMLPSQPVDAFCGTTLKACLHELALYPLPKVGGGKELWDNFANKAYEAARIADATGNLDEWIAASQAADPARKSLGAYGTPQVFAHELARATLGPLLGNKPLRIVDPSAGSGALLLAALRIMRKTLSARQLRSQVQNLYGAEIDPAAREHCCLLIWLEAGCPDVALESIAKNVVAVNALTRNWWSDRADNFDVLLMNPPWESLRHATEKGNQHSAEREKTLERLERLMPGTPGLPHLYSAHGTGDRNLFKAFVELAPHLIREDGRLGALIPAAFASDLGAAALRARYFDQLSIETWTSFENLKGHFPIDGRYKFGLLIGSRSKAGTSKFRIRSFATDADEVRNAHIEISRSQLTELGGRSLIIPELQSNREMKTLATMLEAGVSFFDSGVFGPVSYRREIDLTLGRKKGQFTPLSAYQNLEPQLDGSFKDRSGSVLVPLIEGRMVGQYDFFQKSWKSGFGRTACWELNGETPLYACQPQYVTEPRLLAPVRIAICDITSATNTRTVLAAPVPDKWSCGNTAPTLTFRDERTAFAGLAVLNSMIFDWMVRRMVAGLHLNKFYLDALRWPKCTPEALQRLSDAAKFICAMHPRAKSLALGAWQGTAHASYPSVTAAHAFIEVEVARGFGLDLWMLEEIFATDRRLRRGFWRHFKSDPNAASIATDVVNSFQTVQSSAA